MHLHLIDDSCPVTLGMHALHLELTDYLHCHQVGPDHAWSHYGSAHWATLLLATALLFGHPCCDALLAEGVLTLANHDGLVVDFQAHCADKLLWDRLWI